MKRYNVILFVFLSTAVLCSGCASRREIVKFKEDMTFLQDRMVALQKDNERIQEQLKELNRTLQSLKESNYGVKADLMSEMSGLKDQTIYLRNLLNDTGNRISNILQRFESMTAIDGKYDSSQTSLRPVIPESIENAKSLYNAAYLDLSKKNYEMALQEFKEYLKKYPQSEFSGNAQYWIGEIYYSRRDYSTALSEFTKVFSDYGTSNKTKAAYLKSAYCQLHLGDINEARRILDKIVQEFPDSDEARMAGLKLKEIK